MKNALLGGLLALSLFLAPAAAFADVWVNGYYRSNGTYVSGHWRSNPDGNPYNNYSYPGNYNPHTGTYASGNASTYLKNYYGYSSYSYPSYSYSSYSYPSYSSYTYPSYTYSYPSYYGYSSGYGSSYYSPLSSLYDF